MTPLFARAGWAYARCTGCPTARLDPLPDAAALRAVFDAGYFTDGGGVGGYADYAGDAALHRRNAADRVRRARGAVAPAAGPWVEVGCATGETLLAAREAGWEVHGVELSDWARERAVARDLPVVSTPAELDESLTGRCGVVAFFQSLEHLPDPGAALADAARLLAPGGVVLVETWDRASAVARLGGAHWQQVSPPSVLWLFHRGAAAGMAARAGLTPVSWRATGKSVSAGFVAGLLAAKYPRVGRPLRAVRDGRLGALTVRYRLGDLVTVVLRRTA